MITVSGGVTNTQNSYTTNSFIPLELRPKVAVTLGLVGVSDSLSMNRPHASINPDGSITFAGGASPIVAIVSAEYSLV
ncbi:MAG: hypothetical protein ACRDA5_08395 [Clostridium sp.]